MQSWKSLVLLAALSAATLAALAASAQTRKLVFFGADSAPSLAYLPVYVADKAGFFGEEGLRVEMRYGRGALTMQNVASGEADIVQIGWQPLILAYADGVRGKLIYQAFTRSRFFVAVEPESPIRAPADLAGKTVALASMASPGLFYAKSIARAGGVKADTLQFVPMRAAQALAALESKQADVLSFEDAAYAGHEAAGKALRYIEHPVIGQIGNGGFFAMDNVIRAKNAELQIFTRAIAKATVFILANPEAALKMYWAVDPNGKPAGSEREALQTSSAALKFVARAWDVGERPVKDHGAIDLKEVQTFIDLLYNEGEAVAKVPAAAIATNEFIASANRFSVSEVERKARDWK